MKVFDWAYKILIDLGLGHVVAAYVNLLVNLLMILIAAYILDKVAKRILVLGLNIAAKRTRTTFDDFLVEELCGVYTFRQVHHLISTVVSTLKEDYTPVDVIRTTFPMGSMTGAPKISAMQIIEKLEETRRGMYSGAVGYFTPQADFDFNVVIRSILYNEDNKYVSFSVGSAITAKANPKMEYEECLLKARAMRSVLED